MRQKIRLPPLGERVDAATVLEWACEVGQQVEAGDTLLSVELDKIDTDIPSPVTGTVVELGAQEGDEVTVGTVICVLDT